MSEPGKSFWKKHHSLPRISAPKLRDWFFRLLFYMACLATLIALFYAEEDLRGKMAWQKYVRESKAKGIELDWRSYIPPAVPDNQNFAMTPIFAGLFDYEWTKTNIHWQDTNIWARMARMSFTPSPPGPRSGPARMPLPVAPMEKLGDWIYGRPVNLKQWQTYFRQWADYALRFNLPRTNYWAAPNSEHEPGHDVLSALRRLDPELTMLRAAAARPQSRFPVHYDELSQALLVHLSYMRNISCVLQLRAIAELASENNQAAFDDVILAFHCADALNSEATMISQIVRCRIIEDDLQSVWEGLAAHRWSAEQLEAFQRYFLTQDLLLHYDRGLKDEVAFICGWIDSLAVDPSTFSLVDGSPNPIGLENLLELRLLPRGWIYQNELSAARFLNEKLLHDVASQIQRVYPDLSAANAKLFDGLPNGPYDFAFKRLGLVNSPQRFVQIQTEINLALVACALERFRMAHGHFPQALEALAPAFLEKLPHDIINGEPLKYRLNGAGGFILYSVGWNGKDDGGIFPSPPTAIARGWRDSSKQYHPENGDWVWRYPESN